MNLMYWMQKDATYVIVHSPKRSTLVELTATAASSTMMTLFHKLQVHTLKQKQCVLLTDGAPLSLDHNIIPRMRYI